MVFVSSQLAERGNNSTSVAVSTVTGAVAGLIGRSGSLGGAAAGMVGGVFTGAGAPDVVAGGFAGAIAGFGMPASSPSALVLNTRLGSLRGALAGLAGMSVQALGELLTDSACRQYCSSGN
jgi:hypothetical protein